MKLNKLVLLLAASGLCSWTAAQAADEKLERVEITGSSLKRINAETASPVQVVNRQQIEAMGARTLQQVLANMPAAVVTLEDSRSMFTGTDGASQANLRGLGPQATLVLLNGRRIAPYGAPDSFQYLFVNIDTLPAAAIERLEILTDGASAIYGSDAVAGVVNVITKRDYQGFEISAGTEFARRVPAFGEHQASATYGFGNIDRDGYNVFGSINLFRRDAVYPSDDYDKFPAGYYVDNPAYIRNFRIGDGSQPGVLNPGTEFVFDSKGARRNMAMPGCTSVVASGSNTSCAVNTLPYALAHKPASDRATLFLSGRYLLEGKQELFADLSYTTVDMRSHNTPRAFNSGSTSTWYSRDTGYTANTFTVPFLGPNNVYNKLTPELRGLMGGVAGLNYIPLDEPGHFGQRNTDANYRVMAGLRGSWGDWDYETAATIGGAKSVLYQTTNISKSGFQKAFGPITIDPATKRAIIADKPAYQFGVQSEANAALLREAFPTFDIPSWTQIASLDAKIEGSVYKLPAGEVRMAVGASLMHEGLEVPGNPQAAAGDITQQGGSWFKGSRNVLGVFTEAVAPLSKDLELNAALRLDKYPNFGANLAPKIGLKYRALPQLLLRGTFSEGFRAPNLAESGNGGVFAQTVVKDDVRCAETNAIASLLRKSVTAGEVQRGNELYNSQCSPGTVIGGVTAPNTQLKPETAKISTLGFVFQPTKDIDLSADYWFTYRRNEIIREDFRATFLGATKQYGPSLKGAPNAFRSELTDNDRAIVAEVAAMCANPANAAACAASKPGYTVGNLSGVITNYVNRGRTLIDGFDIDAQARFSLGEMGKLKLGAKLTIANRNKFNADDDAGWTENFVGYYYNPKLRAIFNADWSYRNVTTSVFVNHIGSHKWDGDPRYISYDEQSCADAGGALTGAQCAAGTPAYTTVNLNVDWKVTPAFSLGLNVKNLFGKQPYYDPNGWEGFDHRFNIFGRIIGVNASYTFK
ncbi:TonB-dependent receptor [Paucibacter sp. APW11]|uniref:TonB-dependent receptor n=1 Tax=Roseateles aquae TaxID=3077235 RepID=A0ABU3P931_9BURK|nr:TonB-dependent receptor [Paucibacter sp. APW11]MDT8999084.1 TonB-dependent receptor [Paucibacter sp. APW11]